MIDWILLSAALLALGAAAPEDLGEPARLAGVAMSTSTPGRDGPIVWGVVQAEEFRGLVGVRLATGEVVKVDLLKYGRSNIRLNRGPDQRLYAYSGQPGHFLRYDPVTEELTDLGVPAEGASYWMRSFVDADDVFWIGTYPRCELVSCDMKTGEIRSHGKFAGDANEKYIVDVTGSDDGVIYCSVGLHHEELWSYRPESGERRQILPAPLNESQGAPKLWRGEDGQVYGSADGQTFRCEPGKVVLGETAAERREPRENLIDGTLYGRIDNRGRLVKIRAGEEDTYLDVGYLGEPQRLYTVGPIVDGRLYGSGIFPATLFTYDLEDGTTRNLGVRTTGDIQVYDIVQHGRKLFLGSYVGASLDVWDLDQPLAHGENPKPVVQLSRKHQQERPNHLLIGPDDALYVATTPVKGRLGGALARVDPETLAVEAWRNVVENQSLMSLASLSAQNQLAAGSSIGGGTSAKPTETEAEIIFWDVAKKEVVRRVRPVEGTRSYNGLVTGADGLLYGVAYGDQNAWFILDPATGETVHQEALPFKQLRFPYLHDAPVGEQGYLYGIADDAVYRIDPAARRLETVATHPTLARAHGFWFTPETVYYNSASHLMRLRLDEQEVAAGDGN